MAFPDFVSACTVRILVQRNLGRRTGIFRRPDFVFLHPWNLCPVSAVSYRYPEKEDDVCSGNTDINLAANRLFGRSWTIGLVTASWINGSAWLFLAFESRGKDWVDPGVYTAYGFLTAAAAAGLLVPVMWGIQKRKRILSAVTEPTVWMMTNTGGKLVQ